MTRKSTPSTKRAAIGHPRNRHQGHYDMPALSRALPALKPHIIRSAGGNQSINFADPLAVKALNSALLLQQYGITGWDIPAGYLCPAVPGRADYIHSIADLLGESHDGNIPTGAQLQGLDIGTGANLVYPLLGWAEYQWRFVGADIDPSALHNGQLILEANPVARQHIRLRQQQQPGHIFTGMVQADEHFDFTLCNPPFHPSTAAAAEGSRRKRHNLGLPPTAAQLNFGGQHNELVCTGGEARFLAQMVKESALIAQQVFWFTSLVSKATNLPALQQQLTELGARDIRTITMQQGHKHSRLLAWTFLDKKQRRAWRRARWPAN